MKYIMFLWLAAGIFLSACNKNAPTTEAPTNDEPVVAAPAEEMAKDPEKKDEEPAPEPTESPSNPTK